MSGDDLDIAGELNERGKWGENRLDRVARKMLAKIEELEADRDAARDAIVALRARVKALEDKAL